MKYPKRSQYKYAKSRYRTGKSPEYEAGLRRRGDLTAWLSSERSRTFAGQRVEVQSASEILNTKTCIGRKVRSALEYPAPRERQPGACSEQLQRALGQR